MPNLLAFVATINYVSWPDLGITMLWAEIVLGFTVSKAVMVATDCATRPGSDFRHKPVNGAQHFANKR